MGVKLQLDFTINKAFPIFQDHLEQLSLWAWTSPSNWTQVSKSLVSRKAWRITDGEEDASSNVKMVDLSSHDLSNALGEKLSDK